MPAKKKTASTPLPDAGNPPLRQAGNPPLRQASRNHTLVLCDPEDEFLAWAGKLLAAPGVEVRTTRDSRQALEWLVAEDISVALVNAGAEPLDGETLLRQARLARPDALVILTADFPPSGAVIRAMSLGAHDYVRKGALALELRRLVEEALTARESRAADPVAGDQAGPDELLIARSPGMQEIAKLIGRIARSHAPVLITGESGSGKEVVARAIHRHGPRARAEFVAINCAAIPEALLESELFGHEKGSFTGAHARRIGRFEQSSDGTLFLDEIGDMPLAIQAKLLRVLQENQFSRVGGNEVIETKARIIAATHRNLEAAIAEGSFREDLYYRLNVVRLQLPPLRERLEDIRPLANFFLQRLQSRHGLPPVTISSEGIQALERHHWPGNVRELENTLHRAAVLAHRQVLLPADLPLGQVHNARHDHKEIERLARQLLAAITASGSEEPLADAVIALEKLARREWGA